MKDAILSALAAGHHTTVAIAKHIGKSERAAAYDLHALAKKGVIKREQAARRGANTWMVGDKVPAYTTAGWKPYTKPREAPRRPGSGAAGDVPSRFGDQRIGRMA